MATTRIIIYLFIIIFFSCSKSPMESKVKEDTNKILVKKTIDGVSSLFWLGNYSLELE